MTKRFNQRQPEHRTIVHQMDAFLMVETWSKKHLFLEEHADVLLSDTARTMLRTHITHLQISGEATLLSTKVLEQHLHFLDDAAMHGIGYAWGNFLATLSQEEARTQTEAEALNEALMSSPLSRFTSIKESVSLDSETLSAEQDHLDEEIEEKVSDIFLEAQTRHYSSRNPLVLARIEHLLRPAQKLMEFEADTPETREKYGNLTWLPLGQGLALLRPGDDDPLVRLRAQAIHYRYQWQFHRAEKVLRQLLAMCIEVRGPNHPDVALCLNDLAGLVRAKESVEAKELLLQAKSICESTSEPDPRAHAIILSNLADIYTDEEKYTEAAALLERVITLREQVFGCGHMRVALALDEYEEVLKILGREKEAAQAKVRAATVKEKAMQNMMDEVVLHEELVRAHMFVQPSFDEEELVFESDLLRQFEQWLETRDWNTSRTYIYNHPALLTSQVERVVRREYENKDHKNLVRLDEKERDIIDLHILLLNQCIEKGINAAYMHVLHTHPQVRYKLDRMLILLFALATDKTRRDQHIIRFVHIALEQDDMLHAFSSPERALVFLLYGRALAQKAEMVEKEEGLSLLQQALEQCDQALGLDDPTTMSFWYVPLQYMKGGIAQMLAEQRTGKEALSLFQMAITCYDYAFAYFDHYTEINLSAQPHLGKGSVLLFALAYLNYYTEINLSARLYLEKGTALAQLAERSEGIEGEKLFEQAILCLDTALGAFDPVKESSSYKGNKKN